MKQLLHDMVSEQCDLHPASTALVFRNDALTYEELERASNRVANALRAVGCGAGDRVAIMMPKSIEAVVSILGTLKAGCIYVPIDPAGPAERTARIFDVCELKCVLAGGRADGKLRELGENGRLPEGTAIGWIEAGAKPDLPAAPGFSLADLDAFSADAFACGRSPEDVAHILFTSGSTGVPKGVPITHANAMHFVRWAQRYFGISSSDRISGHPPLIFDLSTFDMYATLGAGASLYLVPPELNLIPHRLADFIRDNELTQWFSVPSILNHMAKHDVVRRSDFPSLKRLLWCGEAFPTPALIYWMQRLPSVSFTNLYGPTEATIASSYYRVPRCPEDPRAPVSIGEACDGEELLILD
ncbi:MAG: AMP-binding protein, partial [bacterium]|nr:AMP-binding protein [bacterium]